MNVNSFKCPVCDCYYDGELCENCGYENYREKRRHKKDEQNNIRVSKSKEEKV